MITEHFFSGELSPYETSKTCDGNRQEINVRYNDFVDLCAADIVDQTFVRAAVASNTYS